MGIYTSNEINLNYNDYMTLYREGKCNIGINRDVVEFLNNNCKEFIPINSKTTIICLLLFGYTMLGITIYLSFTSKWWIFIIGVITMWFLGRQVIDIKAKNAMTLISNNIEIYDALKGNGLLSYEMDNNIAKNYM